MEFSQLPVDQITLMKFCVVVDTFLGIYLLTVGRPQSIISAKRNKCLPSLNAPNTHHLQHSLGDCRAGGAFYRIDRRDYNVMVLLSSIPSPVYDNSKTARLSGLLIKS